MRLLRVGAKNHVDYVEKIDSNGLGVLTRCKGYYNMMSFSLNTVWQKEPILRRNLGHSRFDTARTTDGGAQPPGFTTQKIV